MKRKLLLMLFVPVLLCCTSKPAPDKSIKVDSLVIDSASVNIADDTESLGIIEVDGIYYEFINNNTEMSVVRNGIEGEPFFYPHDVYPGDYSGKVVIPNFVIYEGKSYKVTSIEDYAFSGCDSLTSITIPKTIKSIGEYAFMGCEQLRSITIPNSVTSIGDGAFSACGLTSITIPKSVTSIGFHVFGGFCYGINNQKIDMIIHALINEETDVRTCKNLTSIKVDKGNRKYDSRDNCNAIIETKSNTLITGCKNTIIPNSVKSIEGLEYCTGMTSINIPNSVKSIGTLEFCTGLTSINIPNSVKNIQNCAFFGCTSLKSITIPNSVTSIGDYVFCGCSKLKNIYIARKTSPKIKIDYGYEEGNYIYSFAGVPKSCTLHVPKGCKKAYKNKEPWRNFSKIIDDL